MKTKRHFLYTEQETKYSRTYGGRSYTLAILEIKSKGDLVRHGTIGTRCSRGHMGEESEAWNWIYHNLLSKAEKRRWNAAAGVSAIGTRSAYYSHTTAKESGFKLEGV